MIDIAMLLLWGFIVGSFLVSSSVQRTLAVANKDVKLIVLSNGTNAIFYYISVHFVVKDDIFAYMGSVCGGLAACLWLIRK